LRRKAVAEGVAYWWRGRLHSEREAPQLAIPLKLVKVEAVEWLCPRCGERAEWGPEPKCPVCGARCEPRTRVEEVPELVDALSSRGDPSTWSCRTAPGSWEFTPEGRGS
jgi:NMD protein affecting ribosome stability and mRNA decay